MNPNVVVDLSYPLAPGAIPSPIMPGVEKRFREFVEWLRSLPGYENSIGVALRIVGAQSTAPDPASVQPVLKLRVSGGKVEVLWGWEGARSVAKALYMEVDRGTGPTFLAVDTNPNYTDSFPLPATPQKWRYRAIFQDDSAMIGQWSSWVEITVGA